MYNKNLIIQSDHKNRDNQGVWLYCWILHFLFNSNYISSTEKSTFYWDNFWGFKFIKWKIRSKLQTGKYWERLVFEEQRVIKKWSLHIFERIF